MFCEGIRLADRSLRGHRLGGNRLRLALSSLSGPVVNDMRRVGEQRIDLCGSELCGGLRHVAVILVQTASIRAQ